MKTFSFIAQKSLVFMWDMKGENAKFQRAQLTVDIPRETILEVEVVEELTGEVCQSLDRHYIISFLISRAVVKKS